MKSVRIGSITGIDIGKAYYAPLDENLYLNGDGFYRITIDTIFDYEKINDFLEMIVEKFKDFNGIALLQNDNGSNKIESDTLLKFGFIISDTRGNYSIYLYKNNCDVSDVLFN